MRTIYLTFAIVIATLALSLVSAKDHGATKNKVLKTRSDLAGNDTAINLDTEAKNSSLGEDSEPEKPKEVEKAPVSEVTEGGEATSEFEPESTTDEDTSVALSKPSYLTRVKNILRKVLDLLGLGHQKRKSRKMKYQPENLDNVQYVEEVRATVGALLGRKDCLKRAACGAGTYLRSIKGKEVLIVLLEKFAPTSWAESVNHIKEGAIYKDTCDYRCLDD